jgi:hypothetical protein
MTRLPSVHCSRCGRILESDVFTPNARGGARRATDYESCLRRCEVCGIGLSNANTADVARLTLIYRDPFMDLSEWVREGCEQTLAQALNVRNRKAKRVKFASSRSEDHVTWTVFRFLQHTGILGRTLTQVGIGPGTDESREPTLLLWGVPLPNDDPAGAAVREQLIEVSNRMGEHPRYRSEPDVILDFGRAGVALIEVKCSSANEKKREAYPGWDKYLEDTKAFRDAQRSRELGLYELARNWRIGWDLAESRPLTLVNLGPTDLFVGRQGAELAEFRKCLDTAGERRFDLLTWAKLLGAIDRSDDWFWAYAQGRDLL